MSIKSIKSLAVTTVQTTIDIVPLSLYQPGQQDLAKIKIGMQLQEALAVETSFLIPNADFKSQKVYLPNGEKVEFGDFDPTATQDVDLLLKDMDVAFEEFKAQPVNEKMQNTVAFMAEFSDLKSASKVITIPQGIKYITFEYTKFISFNTDTQEYLLETAVPVPDFVIVSQQGSKASLIIMMPLEITDASKVLEAIWTPPNGVSTPLTNSNIPGRVVLSGYWQYDPLIKLRYKY